METQSELYTMKDICEIANLPYETLKFYCNQGLIPNVKRDKKQLPDIRQR